MTIEAIEQWLKDHADPEKADFRKRKFNISAQGVLGIDNAQLKEYAKQLPKDPELGRMLFKSELYESRLLVSKLFPPKALSMDDVIAWTSTFENWEITDSFSLGIYARSPLALEIITFFAQDEGEFQRRTSFATIAGYCSKRNKDSNEVYLSFFEHIKAAAEDDRLYIKKAVSWSLRSIGKRNKDLCQQSIELAQELLESENKSAKWIANDVLKELLSKSF